MIMFQQQVYNQFQNTLLLIVLQQYLNSFPIHQKDHLMIVSKKKKSQAISLSSSKLSSKSYCEPQESIQNKLSQMQKKMQKIINAYKKLEKKCQQKDHQIQQLAKQNKLLKDKIQEDIYRSKEKSLNFQYILKTKDQSSRTNHFRNQKIVSIEKPLRNGPSQCSIIREHKSLSPQINLKGLNESCQRNNQEIYKQKQKMTQFYNNNANKSVSPVEFRKQIAGQRTNGQTEQDLQFFETLQKLKQKINKYESQEQKIVQRQVLNGYSKNESNVLKQVKSVQNIHKANTIVNSEAFNFKNEANKNQQLSKLKNIWNERDKEIKKMDDLFANIDKRINAERG